MLAFFLIGLFGLIALSVPIGFTLIAIAFAMMVFQGQIHPEILTQRLIGGIDNFPLLAIPFFLIAGEIMNYGGISRRIVKFADSLVGHITGGFGYVSVLAAMIFAGVSGSAVADTVAVGSILLPIMKDQKYSVPESTALLCSAGCIGPIIPPSIPLILFGVIGEVSIVKLFLGGIIPGIVIGLGLMVTWYFYAKKRGYTSRKRATFREVLVATRQAFLALLTPVIILGGIVGGIVTPTEAGVIAVVYAFLVSTLVYHELKLSQFPRILISAIKTTATIMLVVGGATTAAYLITTAEIPQLVANALLSISHNPYIVMLLINILLLMVGIVMDMGPAILIVAPILLPIVTDLGLDPVYFGVIMTVNLCIGLLTPPVGNVLYAGTALGKIEVLDLAKSATPFLAVMIVMLLIMTYLPGLVMFIPSLMHN